MNDWVIPGGQDRLLTNAFSIKKGDWSVANLMYTPTDKRSLELPDNDRPWDGYSYLEHEHIESIGFGHEYILRSRIGLVGRASGAEALQKFIHNDLGAGADPSWAGQNKSEITSDFIYSKRTREYIQSVVGNSRLTNEFGARVGTVNVSVFLDQELRKHFFKYFYPYAGIRGEAVAYNTHLDGRLFSDNNYTVDKEWFVASARAGIELYFPGSDFFIDYHYQYITQEFKGQLGRHAFGSLSFGCKF